MRRGELPVLLARVHDLGGAPAGGEFTDRLVAKFDLPVAGWRGRLWHGPAAGTDAATCGPRGARGLAPRLLSPKRRRARRLALNFCSEIFA